MQGKTLKTRYFPTSPVSKYVKDIQSNQTEGLEERVSSHNTQGRNEPIRVIINHGMFPDA